MSERISVGDLVQVVRPAVCPKADKTDDIGLIFKVLSIKRGALCCHWCGSYVNHGVLVHAEGPEHYYGVARLKRIPPLSELEGIQTQEPIKETA